MFNIEEGLPRKEGLDSLSIKGERLGKKDGGGLRGRGDEISNIWSRIITN